MKYYITADVHGFYYELHKALDETKCVFGSKGVELIADTVYRALNNNHDYD